ncbi:DUF1697 domain-containing protein [Paenibacillus thalictri]|uniref:DUF1697 domain-containing protein n=1 Tax=Paenibacillus thalictri TaxID=2527873 RepID=A0A4Q9DN40_9BACL|nr:DUF1697 domain-containing protein [Paenibacillus thalictri]TBL73346.1 DUF1697 domain-containing protein [Paenibacillus thalictri]
MATYIALLRGINVGGNNKIKMAELRHTLTALGLSRVQTYIQSGNVLFDAEEPEETLQSRIEQAIKADFGIELKVVLRKAEELRQVAANCPFSAAEVQEAAASCRGECLHVAFLTGIPAQEGIDKVDSYKSASDDYRIIGREVYLLFRSSILDSKLANNLHKLGVSATVRNWKTLSKLVSMADEMEA